MLALEPEAASLCCRRPSIAGYRGDDGVAFPPDTMYLLLDCGGAISYLSQFLFLSLAPFRHSFNHLYPCFKVLFYINLQLFTTLTYLFVKPQSAFCLSLSILYSVGGI